MTTKVETVAIPAAIIVSMFTVPIDGADVLETIRRLVEAAEIADWSRLPNHVVRRAMRDGKVLYERAS